MREYDKKEGILLWSILRRLLCSLPAPCSVPLVFKLLSSSDAKKFYTQTTAAVLRMKDSTMETVSKVQEQAGDILEDAKAINEARAAKAEAEVIEDAAEAETTETNE